MFSVVADGVALADDGQPTTTVMRTAQVPAPAMPADLSRRVQEVADVVLEHHIDPPARQQMILSGIKMLYRSAGLPAPPALGRRASAVATPEQLATLLAEVWPKTTAKPISAEDLEESLFNGLLIPIPGGADLMTAKESRVAESMAGNRYVGIHIALGMDDNEKRPMMHDVFEGGPADRAGIKKGDLLEEVDGVDTKGMKLRDVVDRLRGDEGTDVTVKVRTPKEAKSRTVKLTRGQLPRATILGIRKESSGDWKLRLDGLDPIGYLKISEITASTPHELRKMARQMESEGIRALVLDLRGLQGRASAVHPAVLMADSLLEGGAIGRVWTTRGETTYQADSDALFRGWPIAVLIDQNTAGSAEWIAAALQDNHRAVVVGSPSRGAGRGAPADGLPTEYDGLVPFEYEATVRSTIPVGDGRWTIALVTAYLERGDGRPLADPIGRALAASLNREKPKGGVQPDHLLPPTQHGPNPLHRLHGPITLRRTPDQKAETSKKAPEKPDSATDPILNAAVKVLHEVLIKR
jgi:carboxyl-terminal processing protease